MFKNKVWVWSMSIIVMYLKISYLVTEILFVLISPSAGSTTEQSSHIGITGKHITMIEPEKCVRKNIMQTI